MKFCLLSNQSRSMAIFWRVLIRTLVKRNISVLCLTPEGDPQSDAQLADMGATVKHYKLDRKGLNPLADMATFVELKKLFALEKPDILFATTIKPVIYGCQAAHMSHIPGIFAAITGLGYAFESENFLKKMLTRLAVLMYRQSLSHAQGIFFQNMADRDLFVEKGIIKPAANIYFTPGTGVDTERFQPVPFPPLPPQGLLVFILICRLLIAKGIEDYARAAKILKQRFPDARFQILGPPETGHGSLPLDTVKKWQAEGLVEYLGECRDVRPYLGQAHVAVLPSWREGTSTFLMEAMSMGRACVASDVPGCREVVRDGVNGFLAEVRNPQSLAAAMEKFLLNPELVRQMGQAGRDLAVNSFDAQKTADGILEAMHSTASLANKWPE